MLSFLASIILYIERFFNYLIESFVTLFDVSEENISTNIKSGKIFHDAREIEKNTHQSTSLFTKRLYRSPFIQSAVLLFLRLINVFVAVHLIKTFYEVMRDMWIINGKFFKYSLFILFFGIFPLAGLLVFLISTSSLFFIYFIPIIALALLMESGLFNFIEKRNKNEQISIFRGFLFSLGNFESVILFFLFYILLCTSLLILPILALSFFIESFNTLAAAVVILLFCLLFLLSFLVLFSIFYLSILVSQAYFVVVLERESPISAIIKTAVSLRRNSLSVFIHYITLFLLCLFVANLVYIYLSDIALMFSIAFIFHFFFLYTYSLRRKFLLLHLTTVRLPQRKQFLFSFLFSIFFFAVIIVYIFFASFIIRSYQQVLDTYSKWQFDKNIQENSLPYVNSENGYSIFYPKGWSVYEWNNKSVTLYYNVNNTSSGSIAVNIEALPILMTDYYRLSYSKSGEVISNEANNEQITKISDLFLDGYTAIKYSDVKTGPSLTEYKTIYLVLKGDSIYKISFITVNSVFQKSHSRIFDIMIGTFRFTR